MSVSAGILPPLGPHLKDTTTEVIKYVVEGGGTAY